MRRLLRPLATILFTGLAIAYLVWKVDLGTTAEDAFVSTRDATFRGRYVIDASGQSRLLARRHASAVSYDRFGSVAVFTHYDGVSDATWAEFEPLPIVASAGEHATD